MFKRSLSYKKINQKIIKLYTKVFDSGLKPEDSFVKAAILFHAWKAFVSQRAASKLLSKKVFNADAQIIIRSILNIVINITYILKEDSENRAELWANHAAISKANMLKALLAYDSEYINQRHTQEESDSVFQAAEYAKNTYGFDDYKPWSNKTIRQMAVDVGLAHIYDIIYSSLSDIEHTNANSADNYLKVTSKRGEFILKNTVLNTEMLYSLMNGFLLSILSCLLKQYNLPELKKEFDKIANVNMRKQQGLE